MKNRAACALLTGGLALFGTQAQSQELLGDVLKQDLTPLLPMLRLSISSQVHASSRARWFTPKTA